MRPYVGNVCNAGLEHRTVAHGFAADDGPDTVSEVEQLLLILGAVESFSLMVLDVLDKVVEGSVLAGCPAES